jgi:L-ascorbate metabolism protein UlaG (beta-lactamase superfamily)
MKILDISGIKMKWLGHDSFRFDFDGKIMYIDPFQVTDEEKADIILITHEHYDHCSIADLKKLTKESTLIVATPDVTSKLSGKVNSGKMQLVKPGDTFIYKDVKIRAVPAYNLDKPFHPKENEWLGYVFTIRGVTFYHTGDSDLIPEMSEIKCDVALLPISGTYVMTAAEAAEAAKIIKPKIAIPMHYGKIIGSKADAEKFKSLCTSCEVRIMD